MPIKDVYGDCGCCGGEVDEQKIRMDFWWEGKLYLIEDVPAGICQQCGEKYYTAKVSKGLDDLVRSHVVERTLQVPVKRFKEAYAV